MPHVTEQFSIDYFRTPWWRRYVTVTIIGFNLSHDSSACLVENGSIRAALALERAARVKRGTVPHHEYAAAMADLTEQLLADAGCTSADVDYWIASSTESRDENEERRLTRYLGLIAPPQKVLRLPHPGHHLAHAAAAFYCSGFEEAVALVIDAYGSLVGDKRERETAFYFRQNQLPGTIFRLLRESSRIAGEIRNGFLTVPEPLSGIGELYRIVTLCLGFRESGTKYDDAGKTMGLSAHGKRISTEALFMCPDGKGICFDRAISSLCDLGLAEHHDGELRLTGRLDDEPISQFHCDLAAQIQAEFEDVTLHLVRRALAEAGSRRLVLSGGCFLNAVLNGRILRESGAKEMFVFPAATDDGTAVGAALYAHHVLVPTRRMPPVRQSTPKHVFWGPNRLGPEADIPGLAHAWGLIVHEHREADMVRTAAAALADGDLVAWFQGRSEFGPRALGGRSILSHPGVAGMKDKLNARVKFREGFRPFAASILKERAREWFDVVSDDQPFMLLVCRALLRAHEYAGEIVHVDGSCRIQTVAPDFPGAFRKLLEEFDTRTGLPLLLNTSLNLRGMPIVEKPEEAFNCLYGARLDRLFIGSYEILAPRFEGLRPISRVPTLNARRADDRPGHYTITDLHGRAQIISGAALQLMAVAKGDCHLGALQAEGSLQMDKLVDLALELRWRGLLEWADLPSADRPAFSPVQYTSSAH
jgi:carbamoyltransferase